MQSTPNKTYHAAIYVRRKFTDIVMPDEEDLTTAAQVKLIKEQMDEYPDLTIDGIYMDRKRAKQADPRPEFFHMLQDLHSGKYNCVIMYSLETFGKDHVENQYYLLEQFPMLRVRMISIKDNYDSLLSEPMPGAYHRLEELVARHYQNQKSRNHVVWNQKHRNITYISCQSVPYGYLYNPEIPEFMEPDPVCMDAIPFIFHEYNAGTPISVIRDKLMEQGYPCPSRRRVEIGYWPKTHDFKDYWSDGSIRTILKNRTYTGDLMTKKVANKLYLENEINTQRRFDGMIMYENHHKPLITKEEFEKAQIMMSAIHQLAKRKAPRKSPLSSVPHLFQNVIYCGLCKRKMMYQRFNTQGRYAYGVYRCASIVNKLPDACQVPNYRVDELEPIVREELEKQRVLAIKLQQELSDTGNDSLVKRGMEQMDGEIQKVITFLSEKPDPQENLTSTNAQDCSVEVSKASSASFAKAKVRLVELLKLKREFYQLMVPDNSWITYYAALPENFELSRDVVTSYIDRIEIYPDKIPDISFRNDYMRDQLLKLRSYVKDFPVNTAEINKDNTGTLQNVIEDSEIVNAVIEDSDNTNTIIEDSDNVNAVTGE